MERYVNVGNARIWTDIRGSADRYAVLCAGGPGCCDYLLPVSRMIEDGYSVVRFEQRGCGRSQKGGNYDIHTAIGDMEAIRAFYGIDAWTVGGHSWGANLALAYAMRHPERTQAILYLAGNGVQRNREWSAQYHENRKSLGEAIPDMAFAFSDEVNKACNASWQQYIQRPALYRDIAALECPALILCATQDIRPNWPAQQLHALMRNAELTFIEGAAHFIWPTYAGELRARLRSFLNLP